MGVDCGERLYTVCAESFGRYYLAFSGEKFGYCGFERSFGGKTLETFLNRFAIELYHTESRAVDFAFGFKSGFINSVVG